MQDDDGGMTRLGPNVNVTGATQLHRGASVLTAGLAGNEQEKRNA